MGTDITQDDSMGLSAGIAPVGGPPKPVKTDIDAIPADLFGLEIGKEFVGSIGPAGPDPRYYPVKRYFCHRTQGGRP